MHEQLDLFGGEPIKPRETPKKKYALLPPEKVMEELTAEDQPAFSEKQIEKDTTPEQHIAEETQDESVYTVAESSVDEQINTELSSIKEKPGGRQAISTYSSEVSAINIPEDEILFSKQYYAISDVASMFNVNISLLRFWEKEFDILKPRKNKKGDRLFRPDDIKNLKLIYFLLREKKYTIEGARSFIKKGKKANDQFEAIESLKNIRKMLVELKDSLS